MPGATFADPVVVDWATGSYATEDRGDGFTNLPLYVKIDNVPHWARATVNSFTTTTTVRWQAYRPIDETNYYNRIASGIPYYTTYSYAFRAHDDGSVIFKVYNTSQMAATTIAWTPTDTAPDGPYRPDLAIDLGSAASGSATFYGYNPEVGENYFKITPAAGSAMSFLSDTSNDYLEVYEALPDGLWTDYGRYVTRAYGNVPQIGAEFVASGNTYWLVMYPNDPPAPAVAHHMQWQTAAPPPYVVANDDFASPITVGVAAGGSLVWDNTGATKQTTGADPQVLQYENKKSIWYKFTSATDRIIKFTSVTNTADNGYVEFQSFIQSGSPLKWVRPPYSEFAYTHAYDAATDVYTNTYTVLAKAGVEYRLMMTAPSSTISGWINDGALSWTVTALPANSSPSAPVALPAGTSGSATVTNPSPGGLAIPLWYSIPAPTGPGALTVRFDFPEAAVNPYGATARLHVYDDGTEVLNLAISWPVGYGPFLPQTSSYPTYAMAMPKAGRTFKVEVICSTVNTVQIGYQLSEQTSLATDWIDSGKLGTGSGTTYVRPWWSGVELAGSPTDNRAISVFAASSTIFASAVDSVEQMDEMRAVADVAGDGFNTDPGINFNGGGGYFIQWYNDNGAEHNNFTASTGIFTRTLRPIPQDAQRAYAPITDFYAQQASGLYAALGYVAGGDALKALTATRLKVDWEDDLNPIAGHNPEHVYRTDLIYVVEMSAQNNLGAYGVGGGEPPLPTGVNFNSEFRDASSIGPSLANGTTWLTPAQMAALPMVKSIPIASGYSGVTLDRVDGYPGVLDYDVLVPNIDPTSSPSKTFIATTNLQSQQVSIDFDALRAANERGIIRNARLMANMYSYAIDQALTYPRYRLTVYSPSNTPLIASATIPGPPPTMQRTHLHHPMVDGAGNVLVFGEVTLLDPDSGLPVEPKAYDGPQATAEELAWPITFAPGIVDLWLDEPGRYDIRVAGPDGYRATLVGMDLPPAPDNQVQAASSLHIDNAGAPRKWIQVSGGALRFTDPGLIAAHEHDGTSANSTLVTSVSVDELATSVALGFNAVPAAGAVALGAQAAPGSDGVVLGRASSAGASGVTLGDHNTSSVVQAVTLPLDSTGVASALVDDDSTLARSVRLEAAADEVGSTIAVPAVPAGVTHPLWLRAGAVSQGLRVNGNVVLGSATGQVGFFESGGATKATVPTGSTGALASLVAALTAYGLV